MVERLVKWWLKRHQKEIIRNEFKGTEYNCLISKKQAIVIETLIKQDVPYFVFFNNKNKRYLLINDITYKELIDALSNLANNYEDFKSALTDMVIDLNR